MNRLIQRCRPGTVIAAAALYCVAKSGFQCAMMAPMDLGTASGCLVQYNGLPVKILTWHY